MGILDGMLGHASEVDIKKVAEELEPLLISGEEIEKAFKLIRDLIVFTNKRLILVDKQGVTGHKVDYTSLPYDSITAFSTETAGRFDLDSELKVWVRSLPTPVKKQFKKGQAIIDVQKTLAKYVLKKA